MEVAKEIAAEINSSFSVSNQTFQWDNPLLYSIMNYDNNSVDACSCELGQDNDRQNLSSNYVEHFNVYWITMNWRMTFGSLLPLNTSIK